MSETSTEQSPKTDPQQDLLLDHNYDGIQEYDNPMPRWWLLLFWGTFLFAAGYFFHFALSPNGRGVYAEYQAQMKVAAVQAEKRALAEQVTEESLQDLMGKEAMVLAGQAVFQQRCVACHNDHGQGKIGPNLTDEYALHGGTLMDIYGVVHDGVVEKGMQAWGKTLKPIELRQVVAFVGSLRGTNVPGKAPQGEKFDLRSLGSVTKKRKDEAAPAAASADAGDAGMSAAPVDSGGPRPDGGEAAAD
jgi:cytochrome c oxidase cbb3-type subunit 3